MRAILVHVRFVLWTVFRRLLLIVNHCENIVLHISVLLGIMCRKGDQAFLCRRDLKTVHAKSFWY